MQNLWYLVAAYGIIWATLFLYVFSIELRQRRLREELAALESETLAAEPSTSERAGQPEVHAAAPS